MPDAIGARLIAWYAARGMSARMFIAACAGAIGGLGQAPFALPAVGFLAFVCAFWFLARTKSLREAAYLGAAFGTGYFALTLSWIVEPFLVDVARHGWMAPFALVFMAVGLSLFWAAAFGVARCLGGRWALVPAWALAEMARAYVLTGFPWAMPSQGLVDGIAGQAAAWIGPHGVNLALFAAAALASRWQKPAICLPAVGIAVGLILWPLPDAAPISQDRPLVRLVQPNAPQDEKWDPERIPDFLNRKLDYTAAGPDTPDLIVWPETSVPYLMEYAQPVFDRIAEAAGGAPVVAGLMRFDGPRLHNSLAVIGASGQVEQLYDKHHLVPFGEYVPFADLAAQWGIFGLAADRLGGYSPGPGPRLIDVGGIGRALPLICYEAVFPQDVGAVPARADFLLQITNDAWFGRFSGPFQHLAQARMRAIEQGIPMVRVANTGVSAMIDTRGQVLASIPLGVSGFLDARLPAPAKPTIYARTGDNPLGLLLIVLLSIAVLRRVRKSR